MKLETDSSFIEEIKTESGDSLLAFFPKYQANKKLMKIVMT